MYHNIPPVVTHGALEVELGFMSEEEERKIKEEMRPQKVESIPLDKTKITVKRSQFQSTKPQQRPQSK